MNAEELAHQVNKLYVQAVQLQAAVDALPKTSQQAASLHQQFAALTTALRSLNPGNSSPASGPEAAHLLAAASLPVNQEEWRALCVGSPVGIFTSDVLGRCTYTNPRCQAITGFTLAESLGNGWETFVHPDDRPRVMASWYACARAAQSYSEKFRCQTSDGIVRWVQVQTSPMLSDQGELLGHTGTVQDITKQQQVEEQIQTSLGEKEALLKEIHHRVKNNLQIISSLLYLQAQRIEDDAVRQIFEDSQSRISSMALVHDSLYRSQDFANINFSDYIQTLTASLFHTYRIQSDVMKLTVKVPEQVSVNLDRAIPCGLILNELITNALKHGFRAGQPGEITVRLVRQSETKIALIVENDGHRLPEDFDLQNTRSMGLRLVHALVNQLKGQLTVERLPQTRFIVSFDGLR